MIGVFVAAPHGESNQKSETEGAPEPAAYQGPAKGSEFRRLCGAAEVLFKSKWGFLRDFSRALLLLGCWASTACGGGDPEDTIVERGEREYMAVCATCHLEDGRGMQSPLVNSRWVLGSEESLIRIVLHGKRGTAEMDMPPHLELNDDQVAAILSYLRRVWGHEASLISASRVTNVRQADALRNEYWTDRELIESEAGIASGEQSK